MNKNREFRVGDLVVVKGQANTAKPGAELLGQHLTVTQAGSIVETSDGSKWHCWKNGGYNWLLPGELPDGNYQTLLKIDHEGT